MPPPQSDREATLESVVRADDAIRDDAACECLLHFKQDSPGSRGGSHEALLPLQQTRRHHRRREFGISPVDPGPRCGESCPASQQAFSGFLAKICRLRINPHGLQQPKSY